MSLLTICQQVLRQIPDHEVPDFIIGNPNATAVNVLAEALAEGEELVENPGAWQRLTHEYIFATVADQEGYDLPDGFRHFVDETWWDRTKNCPLKGPFSAVEWQGLKGGVVQAVIDRGFRVRGNKFLIYPTPTTTSDMIAYEFVSFNWVRPAGGSDTGSDDRDFWERDDDEPLFDESLFRLGVKWRFLKARGRAYQEDMNEYIKRRDALYSRDVGARTVYLDEVSPSVRFPFIPEGDFG